MMGDLEAVVLAGELEVVASTGNLEEEHTVVNWSLSTAVAVVSAMDWNISVVDGRRVIGLPVQNLFSTYALSGE